ncbi:MAG: hypothetical protein HYT70_03145 [Candidatus Aenigmarchaeota archaeon]|nr:hypothetical protein [Candidatus Aenigmarchaeota archaeon]
MQEYQMQRVKIDKETVKSVADVLATEIANRMYNKLLMLKFLPEIKAVEKGKIKALKGAEIHNFLNPR